MMRAAPVWQVGFAAQWFMPVIQVVRPDAQHSIVQLPVLSAAMPGEELTLHPGVHQRATDAGGGSINRCSFEGYGVPRHGVDVVLHVRDPRAYLPLQLLKGRLHTERLRPGAADQRYGMQYGDGVRLAPLARVVHGRGALP